MRVSFSKAPQEPPTTRHEIWAWYSYAFAGEAYVVVALTSFIPITLEALAAEQGHLYGSTEPCNSRSTPSPPSLAGAEKRRCMISLGGLEMDTASFVLYLTSLAVFLQALTVVSISSMADYGSYRKKQLVIFSVIGSIATMLIGAVPLVWMAGALSVLANVAFGAGIVCFNAYLPLLVRNVDRLRKQRDQILQLQEEIDCQPVGDGVQGANASGLEPGHAISSAGAPDREQQEELLADLSEQLSQDKGQLMGQISARGFASGYFGGISLLLICLYISYQDKSSTRSLKIGIFLSGLWWFIFATLAGFWLKPRPGPEMRLEGHSQRRGSFWIGLQYVLYSWRRVGATIAQARKLPSAFAFLVSWFFLSDGYTSIANVALLFAKTSLQLPQTLLILLSLVVPICALIGTLVFPKVQSILGYSQKKMVLLLLFMLVMVPLYGTLGLILPFWPHLSSAKELFALAAYFGFLIGAVQSFCRSMFADLVPRGRESEFFGLYAITDKGSSWLGPLAVAAITDWTHEIRHAFIFLLVLLSLPLPIIYWGVDMDQGRLDADKAAQELATTLAQEGDSTEEGDRLLSSV